MREAEATPVGMAISGSDRTRKRPKQARGGKVEMGGVGEAEKRQEIGRVGYE